MIRISVTAKMQVLANLGFIVFILWRNEILFAVTKLLTLQFPLWKALLALIFTEIAWYMLRYF